MTGKKRLMITLVTSLMLAVPVSSTAVAELDENCPTPSAAFTPSQDGVIEDPTASIDPLRLEQPTAQDAELGPTDIPVYFHVITNGVGTDMQQTVLEKQLEYMNHAFAGGGGESAPTPFTFSMAGTTRTDNASWYNMAAGSDEELAAKTALRVGDQRTLNIYIVRTATGSSWGTFPWNYKFNKARDGVVLDPRVLLGGTSVGNNLGHIAVHEAGHWLGLFHTFHGWTPEVLQVGIVTVTSGTGGCAIGDQVDDTPAEDAPARSCEVIRDTCTAPGNDPVHNFMDYSLDACTNQFTPGQVVRMKEQWNLYRG